MDQNPPTPQNPQQVNFTQQVTTPSSSQPLAQPTQETSVGITVLVILGLLFMYPLGLILMWVLMKRWPTWVKVILTLPIALLPLVILLAITLIAINPSKQFEQANNTKRRSDINTILNAVNQYTADKGSLPPGITAEVKEIGTSGADICNSLAPDYVAQFPIDPTIGTGEPVNPPCPAGYLTGYSISVTSDNKITVSAPHAGLGETLTVSRGM